MSIFRPLGERAFNSKIVESKETRPKSRAKGSGIAKAFAEGATGDGKRSSSRKFEDVLVSRRAPECILSAAACTLRNWRTECFIPDVDVAVLVVEVEEEEVEVVEEDEFIFNICWRCLEATSSINVVVIAKRKRGTQEPRE